MCPFLERSAQSIPLNNPWFKHELSPTEPCVSTNGTVLEGSGEVYLVQVKTKCKQNPLQSLLEERHGRPEGVGVERASLETVQTAFKGCLAHAQGGLP